MEIVIPQNSEVFGSHFEHLPTTIECAQEHGNIVTVLNHNVFKCDAADTFNAIYRHRSTNPAPFERWCFAQWFILADWMERAGRELVFKMDSDVLVFSNLDQVFSENCPSHSDRFASSPPSCSFVTREGAKLVADWLLDIYTYGHEADYSSNKEIVAENNLVDPMLIKIGMPQLATVGVPWMIDDNLYLLDGNSEYEGHKDIYFVNGIPIWRLDGGGEQKMATLHCWGLAKKEMACIYDQSFIDGRRLCLNYRM